MRTPEWLARVIFWWAEHRLWPFKGGVMVRSTRYLFTKRRTYGIVKED